MAVPGPPSRYSDSMKVSCMLDSLPTPHFSLFLLLFFLLSLLSHHTQTTIFVIIQTQRTAHPLCGYIPAQIVIRPIPDVTEIPQPSFLLPLSLSHCPFTPECLGALLGPIVNVTPLLNSSPTTLHIKV